MTCDFPENQYLIATLLCLLLGPKVFWCSYAPKMFLFYSSTKNVSQKEYYLYYLLSVINNIGILYDQPILE